MTTAGEMYRDMMIKAGITEEDAAACGDFVNTCAAMPIADLAAAWSATSNEIAKAIAGTILKIRITAAFEA